MCGSFSQVFSAAGTCGIRPISSLNYTSTSKFSEIKYQFNDSSVTVNIEYTACKYLDTKAN